mmetsp:Transcript_20024/g.34063  ORF Transcript_20024/g.34063 Transcript_20024/m.34063 type:complete len:380 (+) Transcript_20024:162-1301(+)
MDFIETQKTQFPDLADQYTALGNLHEKKLWHQLSLALESFITDTKNLQGDSGLQLYDNFITSFEAKLNQVKLASLASLISRTLKEPEQSLSFLEKVLKSRTRLGAEAAMCLDMDVVAVKLQLGDTDTTKETLEAAKDQLPGIKSTESVVFSKYYRALTAYKKVVGPANEFYSAALMYLSYTSMEDMAMEDRYTLATDMALASITGENIFNFGEVLATPILKSLEATENEWLLHLVEAMNSGNVDQFTQAVDANKQRYFAQPSLVSKHDSVVTQKIVLLCILNMAFERPSHDRVIKFVDISTRAKIPLDRVEWLLMRGMSLGLIKGTIDEVDSTVNISWVQPRVLDKEQLALLSEQIGSWTEKVKSALVTIEDQTAELYV